MIKNLDKYIKIEIKYNIKNNLIKKKDIINNLLFFKKKLNKI